MYVARLLLICFRCSFASYSIYFSTFHISQNLAKGCVGVVVVCSSTQFGAKHPARARSLRAAYGPLLCSGSNTHIQLLVCFLYVSSVQWSAISPNYGVFPTFQTRKSSKSQSARVLQSQVRFWDVARTFLLPRLLRLQFVGRVSHLPNLARGKAILRRGGWLGVRKSHQMALTYLGCVSCLFPVPSPPLYHGISQ